MRIVYKLCRRTLVTNKILSVLQISVIPASAYVIPEGNRVQPGSRKTKRKLEFPPRQVLREQFEKDIEEAAASAV